MNYDGVPATRFDEVADYVADVLHVKFGSDVEEVLRDQNRAFFGFTVDGVSYSLSVNVTE